MHRIGTSIATRAGSGLRRKAHAAKQEARSWVNDRRFAIWTTLCAVSFIAALITPFGWVRSHDDAVLVNLIDFFARGVLVPQLIFFVASGVAMMTAWRWLPSFGILCVSTSWYVGVLTSSTWLYFVEHVQTRISTTFLEIWTPERTGNILSVLAWPLRIFGQSFDIATMVTAASGAESAPATVMWRNFVLLALLTYTVLPRFGLLALSVTRNLLKQGAKTVVQQVVGWRPTFTQPAADSLDWFETKGDEQQCIHAFIAAGLRGRPEQRSHLDALSPDWRKLAENETVFAEFLANDFSKSCPMASIIAFDAARFETPTDTEADSLKWTYQMTLRRALLPARLEWFKIERALRDVPTLEKSLARGPFSWKRWLSIAGMSAVGVGAGVALAPFVGAASIAVAGITVAKGSAAAAVLVAAGGGALGATTGAAIPLVNDLNQNVLIPILARQIALLDAGLVPMTTSLPLRQWLDRSLATQDVKGKERDKRLCQLYVSALRTLKDRGLAH